MTATAVRGLPRRTAMTLNRRSCTEQRVIRMLRGDQTEDRALFVYQEQFARLRDLAHRVGLHINVPGTAWLGADELLLLAWLAQAQRVAGYTRSFHSDATLRLTIVHCAGTLNALGVQLPPLTLQHASLRSEEHTR